MLWCASTDPNLATMLLPDHKTVYGRPRARYVRKDNTRIVNVCNKVLNNRSRHCFLHRRCNLHAGIKLLFFSEEALAALFGTLIIIAIIALIVYLLLQRVSTSVDCFIRRQEPVKELRAKRTSTPTTRIWSHRKKPRKQREEDVTQLVGREDQQYPQALFLIMHYIRNFSVWNASSVIAALEALSNFVLSDSPIDVFIFIPELGMFPSTALRKTGLLL